MLLTQAGHELLEQLERQHDAPSLLHAFQKVVRNYGMTGFCVGDPSPRAKRDLRRWQGNWPAGWYQRYASQNYFFEDPVVARLTVATSPFRWSDCVQGAGAKGQKILREAREFAMHEGFAVPVHGPAGVLAGICIGSDRYDLSPDDERALHMASLFMHGRMQLLQAPAAPMPQRSLTPRERECLKWVASGKTDWEISQILGISEQTVHGYVQNALAKLNARTRAQAVALAIQSAQILQ